MTTGISDESCVSSSGYIYCVGGDTGFNVPVNSSYYAKLTTSGVREWNKTTDYPTLFSLGSCAAYQEQIYCVGGGNGSSDLVFYAPLTSSGIGRWSSSTPYPANVTGESCVTSDGYIYCVGGLSFQLGAYNSTYYAPVSASGVGSWRRASYFPQDIFFQSCAASSNYIYCVGGLTNGCCNWTYYASLSSSGIGTWKQTTSYPIGDNSQSCLIISNVLYCIGGVVRYNGAETNRVFSANVSSSGVSAWIRRVDYPFYGVSMLSCVPNNGTIYCIGGESELSFENFSTDSRVYFAQNLGIVAINVTTSSSSNSIATTVQYSSSSFSTPSTSLSSNSFGSNNFTSSEGSSTSGTGNQSTTSTMIPKSPTLQFNSAILFEAVAIVTIAVTVTALVISSRRRH